MLRPFRAEGTDVRVGKWQMVSYSLRKTTDIHQEVELQSYSRVTTFSHTYCVLYPILCEQQDSNITTLLPLLFRPTYIAHSHTFSGLQLTHQKVTDAPCPLVLEHFCSFFERWLKNMDSLSSSNGT